MFLTLNHQKPEVYKASRHFVLQCYRLSKHLPAEEKFGMISQIRRAALSVHLNIAEGASRKSESERKRFYEVATGSIIDLDAAFDIASDLHYLNGFDTSELETSTIRTFKILSGMIHR